MGDAARPGAPLGDRDRKPFSGHGGGSVVVGHDRCLTSRTALETAVDLASRLGLHLHVVHTVTLADYGVDPDTEEFEKTRDRKLEDERTAVTEALAGAPVSWSYHEESGDPAAQLARIAEQTDAAYIVVGAAHRGLHLHGPTPKRLLHIQSRPVVVVPAADSHGSDR